MIKLNIDDKKWVDDIWEKLDEKLFLSAKSCYDKIPYSTKDGKRDSAGNEIIQRWTNGFWPGLMWLMYVGTKKEEYKKTAENAEKMLDEALLQPTKLSHDVGFMWHISSGINYRLFGGEKSLSRTLIAANTLAGRYNSKGNFIRAWNGEGREGQAIIDCMMNLPLLYLASKITKDKRYYYIAEEHADKTIKTHIRDDGSVRHIVDIDPENGEIRDVLGGQGYSPDSAWSRGQSWAIYGYALSYIHTGKEEYLEIAKKVAHYFIANILDSFIPRVDFRAPAKEHDTTAGAIAACGLIEISKCVGEFEKEIYLNTAIKILKALDEKYCDWSKEEESILSHGVERYFPDERRQGLPIIYGDYYFTEAIYKLKGFEPLFW